MDITALLETDRCSFGFLVSEEEMSTIDEGNFRKLHSEGRIDYAYPS
jgi:hypothetical protein